jgi:hypothetical protein
VDSRHHNNMPISGIRVTISALIAASVLTACSASKWHEVAPNTGDIIAEKQTAPPNSQLQPGQPGYVVPDRLRGRENPNQPPEKAPDILEHGDEVEVVDTEPQGDDGVIPVRPIDPKNREKKQPVVYVPPKYIDSKNRPPSQEQADGDRYFMIQNVATEKLRVYERCFGEGCSHRLILETDMVAGRNLPEARTILGSFRITEWFKFYEDGEHFYPSWYNPTYPQLPGVGAPLEAWLSPSLLPNGRGKVRGKFGWYTAYLGPNADAQWTHGTLGWGADGDRFIRIARGEYDGSTGESGSAGCTRVENQAIAFIREFLPVGTKIVKVYAKEAYRDPERKMYVGQAPIQYDWILTKEGVDVNGPKSGRAGVLARKVSQSQILESGSFVPDQMPDAVPYRGTSGNAYNIPETSFSGYYAVDEGRLVGYEHPRELRVGGHAEHRLPTIMISHDTNLIAPLDGVSKKQRLGETQGRRRVNGQEVTVNEKPKDSRGPVPQAPK